MEIFCYNFKIFVGILNGLSPEGIIFLLLVAHIIALSVLGLFLIFQIRK